MVELPRWERVKTGLLHVRQKYLTLGVLVPIFLATAFIYALLPDQSVHQPSGIWAPNRPEKSTLAAPLSFSHKSFRLTALAGYSLTARILARKNYHWDSGTALAPVDMVLGWGPMSDSATLGFFDFHLSGRYYTWRAQQLPYPIEQINLDLDNNHLIPATSDIASRLKDARVGQIVHIEGMLVRADGENGYSWTSSMAEGSTGGPLSCKLIYVLKFDVMR